MGVLFSILKYLGEYKLTKIINWITGLLLLLRGWVLKVVFINILVRFSIVLYINFVIAYYIVCLIDNISYQFASLFVILEPRLTGGGFDKEKLQLLKITILVEKKSSPPYFFS